VALVAPTGKAAARIKESVLQAKSEIKELDEDTKLLFDQIQSSTIHRLLGYKMGTHYFKHNAQNPLNYDLVIVDESSMIGVSLMAKLLLAVASDKQVILLGDKDQLASVEAGSVFGDICQVQSGNNRFNQKEIDILKHFLDPQFPVDLIDKQNNLLLGHIIELRKSYRFDKNKGIGLISSSVLNGSLKAEDIDSLRNDSELQIFEEYKSEDFEKFYRLYETYIAEIDTLKALRELSKVRVLSPIREGEFSVEYFNEKIESYLKNRGFLSPKFGFYHNQPIMIRQNDYNLRLFNGDIGIIREDEQGQLMAYFEAEDGTLRSISPNFINQYKTVFAMTIHKSQGSEFDYVAVVLPKNDDMKIISKELLYTALTRAKKELWIFSKAEALEKASQKPVQRASGITERLNISYYPS
jgi:exodeoxyribonuclease V alpha subunit